MQMSLPSVLFGTLCAISCSPGVPMNQASVFSDPLVSELAVAACSGDAETVARLAEKGVDFDAEGREGITPLIYTLRCESLAGVAALLRAGADPNKPAGDDLIPFTAAATIQNVEFSKMLLDAGADINGLSVSEETSPLMRAQSLGIHTGYWQTYYALLDRGADINRPYGRNGNTVATNAVGSGRFDMAVDLMERGYRHDLARLLSAAEFRVPNEHQAPYKEQLIRLIGALLEEDRAL